MSTITCPKCGAQMRSYERNSVTIEQCTDCRGVFLDDGELRRLIDLESRQSQGYGEPQPAARPEFRDARPEYREPYPSDRGYGKDDRYRHDDDHYRQGHHKKRKSFLEEIFGDD